LTYNMPVKAPYKAKPRTKRHRSYVPDIIIGSLILIVIGVTVLLIFAYPIPGIAPDSGTVGTTQTVQIAPTAAPSPTPVALTPPPGLPAGSVFIPNPKMPLTIDRVLDHGLKLVLVEGGVLGTRRSPVRQGVEDFVRQAGAAAGVNGTFFANASLRGTDNLLIGPSLCDNETAETLSPFDTKPKLEGRPLVVVSPSCTCIVPYDIVTLSVPGAIQSLLPDVTNAFLGGVWLVHGGAASTTDQLATYNVTDAEDPRRRAFFAIMPDGRPVLGATDGSTTSSRLARALAAAGVSEAVLLDSGFSTSLVFQQTVLVTGHSIPGTPSRPVPHALVLYGQPDPSTLAEVQEAPPTT
jgi:poly-beta-1,6-N-acetyl-D-glucosamine N-deacetylase